MLTDREEETMIYLRSDTLHEDSGLEEEAIRSLMSDTLYEDSGLEEETMKSLMSRKLYVSARVGNIGIFTDLEPEDLSSVAAQENTALHIAAKFGHAKFVEKIISGMRTDLLVKKNSDGNVPLHCAARNGRLNVVEIVLNFTKEGSKEPTTEEEASWYNLLEMTNNEGNTPLHEAARYGHELVATKLVEFDPRLAWRINNHNESALHLAARTGLKRFFQKLVAGIVHGFDGIQMSGLTKAHLRELVRIQDTKGWTAMHHAASRDESAVASILLCVDNSLAYYLDTEGQSPIHIAAACGAYNVARVILLCRPDAIDQLDGSGRNALHIAVMNLNSSVVEEILKISKFEGLINEPDKEGNTPLHLAVKSRSIISVRILVQQESVDVNLKNMDGLTARDLVEQCNGDDVLKIMMQNNLVIHGGKGGLKRHLLMSEGRSQLVNHSDARVIEIVRKCVGSFSVIAAFIATVTFAAAFTVPGGYQSNGVPPLVTHAGFKAFLVSDTISMCCAVVAVFCFTFVNSMRISHAFDSVALQCFMIGGNFLYMATCSMLVAFMTGVYVVVPPGSKLLAVSVCIICCIPVVLLILHSVRTYYRWKGYVIGK